MQQTQMTGIYSQRIHSEVKSHKNKLSIYWVDQFLRYLSQPLDLFLKMSFNQVRRLSTKVPVPPPLSLKRVGGSAKEAVKFNRLIEFYKKVPKGPIVIRPPKGFLERYYRRYIETNSPIPILHAILGFGGIGYYLKYQTHLKFHKNRKHH
ncbi:hypothetical protein G9A89_006741 [Geosiphon pyriformis]|nr:hypothetical protein G9A89_006741 [Geosiphon pyriformis]